jgi:hypothetical protein
VLVVALVSAGQVSAASVSSSRGINAVPHNCKCAAKCQGESCCCGHREPRDEATEQAPQPDHASPSPCAMHPASCGGHGLPSAPSGSSLSKSSALVIFSHLRRDAARVVVPFEAQSLHPTWWVSRLDRPPKRLILA